jgi:NSS family neurotransmitter:Na+ symporter
VASRGSWSSSTGFILAGAGSAVGLGAIWRFPYITGANGGAVFVFVFLFCCFFIGFPVMVAELTLGRTTEKNAVGMFNQLSGKRLWKGVGGLCVMSGFVIFAWYSVIAGWVVGYLYRTAIGTFQNAQNLDTGQTFVQFAANPVAVSFLHALVICMTAFVVYRGIRGGIEVLSKWLMPLLFILLILLAIRSVTLPGAGAGLEFYLKPDFSKFSGSMLLAAMGQALFSLSLGAGTMITYASYLSKKENIVSSAFWITFFEILVSIIAGFMILPAVAAMGVDFAEGPELIFIVLPSIFGQMPGGYFFGVGFFLLVLIAALTSTVSMIEVPVAYVVDEKRWTRKKAVTVMSIAAFIVGTPAALAHGASEFWTSLPGIGTDFFTVISTAFGEISLSVGAFFIAIFAGWVWGVGKVTNEIESGGNVFYFKRLWRFLIRYVAPITIFIIFANVLWNQVLS